MKKKIFLIAIFTVALLSPAYAFAQQKNQGNSQSGQTNRIQKCEQATKRINQKLQKYYENKEQYMSKYVVMQGNIEDLLDKLDEGGYDTIQARGRLLEMEQYMNEFNHQYGKFESGMREAQGQVCKGNNGQFVSEVESARENLTGVRESAKELKNFIDTDLKSSLFDIKRQTPIN